MKLCSITPNALPPMEVDEGRRGRARERETPHRMPPRSNGPSDIKLLHDANSAAAALNAALGPPLEVSNPLSHQVAVPDEGNHSLDSVRNLHDASPEKRARFANGSKMPPPRAPNFGGGAGGGGGYPPLFHGSPQDAVAVTDLGAPASARPSGTGLPVPSPGPQRFDLDEPTWVGSLRVQLEQLVQTQVGMQNQLEDSGRSLRNLQTEIRQLGTGQEHLVRRADAQDHALQQMRDEVRELEKELNILKSAPPSRSVSPAPNRTGPNTPRSEYGSRPQQEVDEMQIVVGGWNECKRDLIEEDVRQMFACMDGGALIRNIHIPYVRCGYCRIELNYPEQDIWKQRKLQGVIVQALKEQRFVSKAPGQENCSFWASRNRSIQERAKVRAVISTYELCVRHVGASVADRDWRGRVWVGTTQVLHHIEHRTRRGDTLMLIDARGNETGWYLDLAQMQACLGVDRDTILAHYGVL